MPTFEWVLASHWAGYKYFEFRKLTGKEQSFLVAAYRTSQRIEAVLIKDAKDNPKG